MKILIMPKMGEMGHFGLGGPLLLGTCSLYVFAFLVAFLLKARLYHKFATFFSESFDESFLFISR